MLASQRQNQIQSLLLQNGAVTISGLMETFGISMETARRDLAAMEKAGLLARVHGGALSLDTAQLYRPLKDRMDAQHVQKLAIAKAAAALVEEGDIISIGGGSTALAFAQALRKQTRSLTVVTYSLDVFEALRDLPDYTLLLTGGQFNPNERVFRGTATQQFLAGVYVHKCFFFPSVLSLENGITCYNQTFPQQIQPMLKQCDQVYVLADNTKFQKNASYQIAPMRQDFIYITDGDMPQSLRSIYADNHLNFIYAE
jgi:DeoR/GlpR family transcriptional regulator of sugar metabolism